MATEMATTTKARMPVRNPDIVSKALSELHDTSGLSWRKIAKMDDYSGIPAGTLAAIAKGYPIPRKWHHRLGVRETKPAPVCLECGEVHIKNGRCPRLPRAYRAIVDMPAGLLRWKLENREVLA